MEGIQEKIYKAYGFLVERGIEPRLHSNKRARQNAAFHLNETLANQETTHGPVHVHKHENTCKHTGKWIKDDLENRNPRPSYGSSCS